MTDPEPPMPPQPTTKQLPRVVVPENTLDAILLEVRAVREEQRGVAANLDVLTGHVDTLTNRVILVERRQDEFDKRGAKHSDGVKNLSTSDAKQDAAIAQIIADVKDLQATQAKQLAILEKLESVAANPMVRRVAYAVGSAVLAYIASKGWLTR